MKPCLSCLCFPALSAVLWAAPPDVREIVDPVPGQLLVYEGKITVTQATGSRPAAEMPSRATLALCVRTGAPGAGHRVIVARTLAPEESTAAAPPFCDVALARLEPSLRLALAGAAGGDPRLRVLDSQLQPEVFPAFALPAGDTAEAEHLVSVPAASAARLPLLVKVSREGGRVTLSRALAAGKTGPTELEGMPAKVVAWSEELVCDAAKKAVVAIRRAVTVQGLRAGEVTEITTRIELAAREIRALAAEEDASMTELEREVEAALAGLQARKPPREIYDRILAVGRGGAARLLPGLEAALRAKLAQYRQEMDTSQRQAAAAEASPLDKQALDFTLANLAGEKVNFRESIRGKVALLCFWYSTCPPCKKEAPHLTKLAEKYRDRGFTVIAVNAHDESRETVKAFVDAQALKHEIWLNGRSVALQYRVLGYPTAFWIDHEGRVVDKVTGFLESMVPEMEARAETLLLAAGAKKAAEGQAK